ncbi:MAG: hypothetical protein B6U88_01230 [Candidatus Aenigmarchaeota archaeon ex4484_56]|nr:MAG: hypothetical protein B6U88_01230 [Candidatus Aenigmarchaeota archaeon ex4484_56]
MVYACAFIADQSVCSLLYEVVFPWIFCFAVIFGLLLKSKIFGKEDNKTARGVSAIIGLVAGYLIVIGFGSTIGAFLAGVTAGTVMFATVIIGIVLLITIINPGILSKYKGKEAWVVIGGIILIAWFVLSGATIGFGYQLTQDLIALIIILGVIGAVAWFVNATGSKKDNPPSQPSGPSQPSEQKKKSE